MSFFQKSLGDLIRGVRAHPDEQAKYISQCMDECRRELREASIDTKATAVSKLTYMQMLHYDVSWAAFNIVEVMCSKKFIHKRIGYLGAAQIFRSDTDVLLLTTNQIKKDLGSQNQYEIGTAISGLAQFMQTDLARDLANDIIILCASTRPYVRKKATLVTYKIFLKYPDALRPTFQRLKEKLDDSDPSVQSCAVNVICELARKNPRNYLSLAPVFFKLLTSSQNNWMRIKIIKLFAALTPLEPRLAKKLIEPLTSLIHQTPAMSLLYECINTVIISVPEHLPSIQLCVTKLRIFIEDADQNLKYLGLQALAEVLKIAPRAVAAHRDLIMTCLDDLDESIRLRALALVGGMCTKKNLQDIVHKLLGHLEDAEGVTYRDTVIAKVIEVSSADNYKNIVDFGWYLEVLIRLTHLEGTKLGKLIGAQLMDVSIRVKVVRAVACKQLVTLLDDSHLTHSNNEKNGVCEVLYAAAYVSGEFSELLESPSDLIRLLLQERALALPEHIQAVFIHNACKIYGNHSITIAADDEAGQESLAEMRKMMLERLPVFTTSNDLEVQERAVSAVALITYITKQRGKGLNIDKEVAGLYAGDLNPVAARAQRKVPIPEGLDLDKWINSPPKEEEPVTENMWDWMEAVPVDPELFKKVDSDDEETKERKRTQRKADNEANPFHLGAGMMAAKERASPGSASAAAEDANGVDVSEIPVKKLDLGLGSIIVGGLKKKKKKKLTKKEIKKLKKKGLPIPPQESSDDEPAVEIALVEDMPEGYVDSGGEDNGDHGEMNEVYKALDVNLDDPLNEDFLLPEAKHHVAKSLTAEEAEKLEKKRKKAEKKAKKKAEKEAAAAAGDDLGLKKKKKKKKDETVEGDLLGLDTEPSAAIAEPVTAIPTETTPAVKELDAWLSDKPAEQSEEKKKDKKDKKNKKKKKKHDEPVEVLTVVEDVPGAEPESVAAAPVAAAEPEKKKKKKDKKRKKKDADEGGAAVPDAATDVPVLATSAYRPLNADGSIAITYDTLAGTLGGNQVQVSFMIANISSEKIASMKLSLLASDAAKLVGVEGEEQLIPFELEPGATNEFRFALDVISTGAFTKLSAGINYMIGSGDAVTEGMLNFKVPLPASMLVYAGACTKDQFAGLLTSAMLTAKQQQKFPTSKTWPEILTLVCATFHVSVLEAVEGAASLYGVTTAGVHLCWLVKAGSNEIDVACKSGDAAVLGSIFEEVKALFA